MLLFKIWHNDQSSESDVDDNITLEECHQLVVSNPDHFNILKNLLVSTQMAMEENDVGYDFQINSIYGHHYNYSGEGELFQKCA